MSKYDAYFRCINGCDVRYELTEIIYTCEKCGGLLEVHHDIDKLKEKSSKDWIKIFEERYKGHSYPYGSGVWGKKELICPNIKNENVVSIYEGGTNLYFAKRFGELIGVKDLWIKQCGNTHTGSFKDLGMTVLVSMVKQMIAEGQDIKTVACASTGDTSAALAAYCATAGIPSTVLLPRNKISTAQLIQPVSNGALVLALDTDFDGCMKIVKELTKDKSIYLANSMNSLRIEGQKTVGIEIIQQFNWEVPDVIIIPGGNLGNVSALGKGILMLEELGIINKRPKIVVAQAENANPLYLAFKKEYKEYKPVIAKKTLASAIQIGAPVSYDKAVKALKEFNGVVEQANEKELADASALGDSTGMFNCPHTGVALAVLMKLIKTGDIKKDDRVVVISTAHGLKFTDFKVKYHEQKIEGFSPKYPNLPVEIPADVEKVKNTVVKHFKN